jgi:hypothetical protein
MALLLHLLQEQESVVGENPLTDPFITAIAAIAQISYNQSAYVFAFGRREV